jgi:hypothetical protein
VEGDAVLFYRFGEPPSLQQLSDQVERMFSSFHARLSSFDATRFCQCQACVSACDLTLKIISHHGEFTSYSVKQFRKLIGKDVIVAHQLLKNDIDDREYWLVTEDLLRGHSADDPSPWIRWSAGAKQTEGGEVPFRYTPLGAIRSALRAPSLPDLEPSCSSETLSASREYEGDIFLFRAVGDLDYRRRWQEGLRRVEFARDLIPRVGMKSVQVSDGGQTTVYSSGYSFEPHRIVLKETDEDRSRTVVFTVERPAAGRVRLTITYHLRPALLGEPPLSLTAKRAMEAELHRSLANLDALVAALSTLPTH